MNLGQAIAKQRKEKGYSQKAFAKAVDLSVNALNNIENNYTFPRQQTLEAICSELKIPLNYLLMCSVDGSDVPEHKRKYFKILASALKEILLESHLEMAPKLSTNHTWELE